MKICMVTPWFPNLKAKPLESQQGIFEYKQTMKLAERGTEFKVISIKWHGQSDHELIADNVEVYRVPSIFVFSQIRYPVPNFIALIREIKRVLNKENFDLIEFVNQLYLTSVPIFLVKKRGIPIIVDVFAIPGDSWFYGDRIIDGIAHAYERIIGNGILKAADGILSENSSLYDYFSRIGIEANRIYAITKGVDTELFQPRITSNSFRSELGIKEKDVVILYVGRLDLVKGVNYLLQAAERILGDHNNIKFLIIGDGNLRREYEKFVKPLSHSIIFTGWRNDIPQLMNIADILVLPSLSEGAANVVMEACASGLPVIATEVGEVPQVVSDGETGVLIKPKDVDGLVEAMGKVIDNPSLARKMGEAGRKRMEKKYSWEIICDKLERAYQDVIDKYMTTHHKRNS